MLNEYKGLLKPCADGVRSLCSGHYNITTSGGPGFDPRARQEKEVPMNTPVCSFVELNLRRSDLFRG